MRLLLLPSEAQLPPLEAHPPERPLLNSQPRSQSQRSPRRKRRRKKVRYSAMYGPLMKYVCIF